MKKQIILSLILVGLFSLQSFAQNKYTINGEIKELTDAYIYLKFYGQGKARKDSAVVKNGKFTFKGSVDHPEMVALSRKDVEGAMFDDMTRMHSFYLENSIIQIKGPAKDFQDLKITGSSTQKDFDEYNAQRKETLEKLLVLYEKRNAFMKAKDKEGAASLKEPIDQLQKEDKAIGFEFVRTHPKSYANFRILSRMAFDNYEEIKEVFLYLDPSLQKTEQARGLVNKMEILSRMAIGIQPIDFEMKDLNGKTVGLKDFKGRYLFVDFWASWCAPCRVESPYILKAYNKFKDKNFTVLGVSLDTDTEKWKTAIDQDGLAWNHISELKGWESDVVKKYGFNAIPANFLVGPDGTILGSNFRGNELMEKLNEILN